MRSFGTEISGNRRLNQELSTETRAAIISGLENNISPTQLAKQFNVCRSTIYSTKKRFQHHHTLKSKPRKGRPQKLTFAEKRYIYLLARRRPKIGYKALIASSGFSISHSTIKRVLRTFQLKKWKAKKRIPLRPDVAKKRLQFARTWANSTYLSEMMFSDECSVQRKSNNSTQYVFRFSTEAYRKDLVNLTNHGKDISQMVWGAIWIGGRSQLVVLERDELSPRGGYSTKSYLACLEKGLLPIYKPGSIFQQDNAKIHVSYEAQDWLERHGIWVPDWPAHSPDLNPIEHLWNLLKKKLLELYPELFLGGRSQIDWTQFRESIQAAWWAIPQERIDRLIRSMPRRLQAVRLARGWYTKY
ncbi:unnamed protein product [Aspergillus oryzae]|uniref:Transposase n=1 Tax=Aspergillus oryzae TaxID=5062 RepID=Q1T726_ASPOZ|nr:transposase [Aspergillus oryzae]GMG13310.1 unnamed protein product [Aspergillus oryzae]